MDAQRKNKKYAFAPAKTAHFLWLSRNMPRTDKNSALTRIDFGIIQSGMTGPTPYESIVKIFGGRQATMEATGFSESTMRSSRLTGWFNRKNERILMEAAHRLGLPLTALHFVPHLIAPITSAQNEHGE